MFTADHPLVEIDRFYAAPRDGRVSLGDAQSAAVERLVQRCEQVRAHLSSAAELDGFIRVQHDPARARRRIALALAVELGQVGLTQADLGTTELDAFCALARRKLAAIVWVFA
jgi:hypothetical protein